jgi:hypothetical protein
MSSNKLNKHNGMFVCTILNKTYANDRKDGLLKTKISLPKNEVGQPD